MKKETRELIEKMKQLDELLADTEVRTLLIDSDNLICLEGDEVWAKEIAQEFENQKVVLAATTYLEIEKLISKALFTGAAQNYLEHRFLKLHGFKIWPGEIMDGCWRNGMITLPCGGLISFNSPA